MEEEEEGEFNCVRTWTADVAGMDGYEHARADANEVPAHASVHHSAYGHSFW